MQKIMHELFLGISLDGDEPFEVIYRVCIVPGVERWRHSGTRKHCGSPEPYLTTRSTSNSLSLLALLFAGP